METLAEYNKASTSSSKKARNFNNSSDTNNNSSNNKSIKIEKESKPLAINGNGHGNIREESNENDENPPNYCCLSESNQCNCCFFTLFSLDFYHSRKMRSKKFNYKCILCGKGCCRQSTTDLNKASSDATTTTTIKSTQIRGSNKKTNNSYASSLRVYENSGHMNGLRNIYTFLLKQICCLFYFLMPCFSKKCCIKLCCSSIQSGRNQNVLDDIEKTSIYFKEDDEKENDVKKSEYDVENPLEHVHVSTATMDNFYFVENAKDNQLNGGAAAGDDSTSVENLHTNICNFCFSPTFLKICLCNMSFNARNEGGRLTTRKPNNSASFYSSKSNNSRKRVLFFQRLLSVLKKD